MLTLLVHKGTRVIATTVAPPCECTHYSATQPKAVMRKHTEIGDVNVCLPCAMQLPTSPILHAYDASDNPVVILADDEFLAEVKHEKRP